MAEGEFPVGFRFTPTEEELVEYYLLPKLQGRPTVPNNAIIEADVYESDPEILINEKYKDRGENVWYFLSPRNRKYPGGNRPSRRTADNRGRWKPSTGQSKSDDKNKKEPETERLCKGGAIKFGESTLAYHLGPPKNETKTKWLMHELTIPDYRIQIGDGGGDGMLLDKYVMCKIYKSPLQKWNKKEEGDASSACEQVSNSSQPGPAPESSKQTAAPPTPSKRQAGKRPAEEEPDGHASSPKRALRPAAPVHGGGGGGGGPQAPPGVGAAGNFSGVPGQPAPPPRPQWAYNRLQEPVQRPRLVYKHSGQTVAVPYSGQAPAQGQPGLRPCPPHRAPSSPGRAMLTQLPNLAAGQTFPAPPVPRPPQQQQQTQEEMDDKNKHRVITQLIAALKEQGSTSCAAQQQRQAASSTQPPPQQSCFDAGAIHPARAKAMASQPQFPARRNCYPCNGGQQQQQCSPAIPAAGVPGGAAAPGNAPSKLTVPGGANSASGNGNRVNNGEQLFADRRLAQRRLLTGRAQI